MEVQNHQCPDDGWRNSRTKGSSSKKINNRRQETQDTGSYGLHVNKSGEVQRDDIIQFLANDEALLNEFLLFRQQQHQNELAPQIAGHFEPYEGQNVVFNDRQHQIYLNNYKNISNRVQLQLQPETSTPNKRRLKDSAGSGGPPTAKHRYNNDHCQPRQEELLVQGQQTSANISGNHTRQNRIPFDQIKRAISSNLPCFYVLFDRSNTAQQIPSTFNAAEKIIEDLKQEGIHINRFTFVG
ncbi:unnamed protein product [Rotaria sordida]|uniref:Uncharacterized protein n=1 Tax=Rotaria sordida TaxID=392033 RepID=A0A815TDY5_9BILA|nr:unnamed protein product [Rotaria sordida]CAF4172802.1 unnamed protein product [Rotaria sordida]